jgi:6-phosphogluconate dehydrogenase (decarboxylating)
VIDCAAKQFATEDWLVQLGMIGLGRMGANMVRRLLTSGHQCVVYDKSVQAVQALVKEDAVGSSSLAEFSQSLAKPRAVWLMVPAGAVDETIADLLPHLARGDILIDGGNSYYIDSAAPRSWRPRESTMSTSAPAAVSGDWSAATA